MVLDCLLLCRSDKCRQCTSARSPVTGHWSLVSGSSGVCQQWMTIDCESVENSSGFSDEIFRECTEGIFESVVGE